MAPLNRTKGCSPAVLFARRSGVTFGSRLTELDRCEGAICALNWVQGDHNDELADYLVSDRFELVREMPMTLIAKDKASSVLCRNRDEVERKRNLLELLHQYHTYCAVKSGLEEGSAKISADPWLEQVQIDYSGFITLVSKKYWEWLKGVAKHAKRNLPKKLLNEPLDAIKEGRLDGAILALDWFLSEENERLATFLKWT